MDYSYGIPTICSYCTCNIEREGRDMELVYDADGETYHRDCGEMLQAKFKDLRETLPIIGGESNE